MDRHHKGKHTHYAARGTAVAGLVVSLALAAGVSAAQIVDRIVANVNGEIILLSDLHKQMATLQNLKRQKAIDAPEGSLTESAILQSMIDERIITHYAKEMNVAIKESEVDKVVDNIKLRNGLNDKTLLASLKSQGSSLEEMRSSLSTQLLIQRITGMEVTNVAVSDEEVRDYYERHKSEFIMPGRVKASHIVIRTSNAGPTALERARETAQSLLERARNGEDFDALASEYSQNTGTASGGDLGWCTMGQMIPALEKTAFSLAKGEIGGPVRTQLGFHLIKVTDREEPEPIPFEKMADQVRNKLSNFSYQQKRMAWMERMREQAYIEVMY